MTPLSRRIKQHIIARPQQFFAATAPWLAPLCQRELQAIAPADASIQTENGGVTFQGRLPECYRANLHLRTASRILMRLVDFKATNFRVLQRKLLEFPWELILFRDSVVTCRIATHQSRLYHRGAVVNCFQEALTTRLAQAGMPAPPETEAPGPQSVFGRIMNDVCTVSLDSSGVLLHKRGLKTRVGQAPLRETLAAGILHLAGYDPTRPLIDPFCGSGTFLVEAAMQSGNIPPGWFRPFAFMQWPAFRSRAWAWLREQAAGGMASRPRSAIIGLDSDAAVLQTLRASLVTHDFLRAIDIQNRDFFDFSPHTRKLPPGLVVLNPPYGHRLSCHEGAPRFYQKICAKLNMDYKGWKYGILAPHPEWLASLKGLGRQYAITHGGLDLVLATGRL